MTILSCCLDLLTDRGPLPLATLAQLAAAAGATRACDPETAVRGAILGRPGQVLVRDDDVCVAVGALLAGRVLTHRLTAEERLADRVRAADDLDLLKGPGHDGLPLLGGGVVRSAAWPGGLHGPPGWLQAHEAGATLAFRLLPEGLDVREVQVGAAELARGRDLVAALQSAPRAAWPLGDRAELTRPLLLLLDADPDLLREPVPPLGELLGAQPDEGRMPFARWTPRQVQLGEDTSELLAHAADDLRVTPESLADALLCAVTSRADPQTGPGTPSARPPAPRDAGEWEAQWYR